LPRADEAALAMTRRKGPARTKEGQLVEFVEFIEFVEFVELVEIDGD
jgi:hypothetical protein